MPILGPAHDTVLAALDFLPDDIEADAKVIAQVLDIPGAEAARLLAELEAAGCVASATGALQ